jgi:HEAT repeat protein
MESDLPSPIEEIIADLSDTELPLLNSNLAGLSNLDSEGLALFKRYWTAIEPKRRRQIVSRLVELAEDDCTFDFSIIFKHCLKDKDEDVLIKAIEGLWENEEPSLINPFIDILEQDNSVKVQTAVSIALGKFTMLAEHRKLRSDYLYRLQEVLLSTIRDNNRHIDVRSRALEAISPLSLPQVKTIINDSYNSSDYRLKMSSIYAMGKNCDPAWLSILLDELNNPDSEIRYEAVCACGELEEEEAVPNIIKLIDDPDIDVQMAAIQALGKIGGSKVKNCLEQCLDDSNEVIRQAAKEALKDMEVKDTLYFSDSEFFNN